MHAILRREQFSTRVSLCDYVPDELLGDGPTDCGSLVDGGAASKLRKFVKLSQFNPELIGSLKFDDFWVLYSWFADQQRPSKKTIRNLRHPISLDSITVCRLRRFEMRHITPSFNLS